MITIRNYTDSDYKFVEELLFRTHGYDIINSDIIREKIYKDPGMRGDLLLIAELAGRKVGFSMGVVREIRGKRVGYVKLMATDPDNRRRGIGSFLYKELEARLITHKLTKIRWYDATLNYLSPGLDPRYTEAACFTESMGFVRSGEALNMDVDLTRKTWETSDDIHRLKKQGIEIRRADKNDYSVLINLLELEWPLWKFEVGLALENDPPSVFIAIRNGVQAFAAYDGNNIGTGWFGPMGTHPGLRGLGIGKVLLYMCLEDLKRKGFHKAIIPWVGPVSFYSKTSGARISRIFWRYEKTVD
jgi:GNAT superfamily N-acetyltransferase